VGRGAAMRLSRRSALVGTVALSLASGLGASGCVPQRTSKIAEGQTVEVGEPTYDQLFVKLKEAIDQTKELDGEAPLRKDVAVAMRLPEETAGDKTIEALAKESKDLKDKGVAISVALSPEPKISGKVAWADQIEKVLRDGFKRADDLAAMATTLSELEPQRAQMLADADTKLRAAGIPVAKIREAKQELADVEEILAERKLKASNESGRAARYTLGVARAVDLTASAPPAPPPAPAETAKKPAWMRGKPNPNWKPPAGGAKPPAGGAKPPPAKPAGKPKGDDFDP
jgi:hypothetical protein